MALLRDWQIKALQEFKLKRKLVAEVATGAGKTFFAVNCIREVLRENPDTMVLIVVPKIVIMRSWVSDLSSFFPINKVGFFYGEMKEYAQITITTIASLKNVNIELFKFRIFDEIHNMYTPQLLKILEMDCPDKLGLSATISDESNGRHWKMLKSFDFNIFKYDMSSAIDDGILNKYDFYNYKVSIVEPEIRDSYESIKNSISINLRRIGGFSKYQTLPKTDINKKILDKLFTRRNNLILNYEGKYKALSDILEQNKDKKIIIFNQYNRIGQKIYWSALDLDLKCRLVNSDQDEYIKKKNIKDFSENRFNILITTKMFDEGYNLPSIDVAIIFSGDSTIRQARQRIGRVLRLKDYKSKIYQIYVKNTFEENYANKRIELFRNDADNIIEVEV